MRLGVSRCERLISECFFFRPWEGVEQVEMRDNKSEEEERQMHASCECCELWVCDTTLVNTYARTRAYTRTAITSPTCVRAIFDVRRRTSELVKPAVTSNAAYEYTIILL